MCANRRWDKIFFMVRIHIGNPTIVVQFARISLVMADAIFMTPTLVRLVPFPIRRMIGTLSQPQLLLETLGLDASPA
jgi:hypothetical protein